MNVSTTYEDPFDDLFAAMYQNMKGEYGDVPPDDWTDEAGLSATGQPLWARVTLGVVYVLLVLVCGSLDSLMIAVVCKGDSTVRTTMNLLLMNMAMSDLLVALLAAPFYMHNVVHGHWVFGTTLCVATGYIKNVSLYVSTNSLVAISVHRMCLTVFPLKFGKSRSRGVWPAVLIMAAIWVVSSLLVLPTVMYTGVKHTLSVQPLRYYCVEEWPQDGQLMSLRTFQTLLLVLEFILPVVIMLVSHTVIATRIFVRTRHTGTRKRDYRAFRLLILIILMFIVCWSPFYGDIVWRNWWEEHWRNSPQRQSVYYFADTVSMTNAMFNAIFNIMLNKEVKTQAGKLCSSCECCPQIVVKLLDRQATAPRHISTATSYEPVRMDRLSRDLSVPPGDTKQRLSLPVGNCTKNPAPCLYISCGEHEDTSPLKTASCTELPTCGQHL